MKIIQIQPILLQQGSINLYALDEEGNIWLRKTGSGVGDNNWFKIDPPQENA